MILSKFNLLEFRIKKSAMKGQGLESEGIVHVGSLVP